MESVNYEYFVSLEVAELLKQAGFDWKTRSYYIYNKNDRKFVLSHAYNNSTTNWNAKQFFMRDIDSSIFVNNGTYWDSITGDYISTTFFSAPTLEVAQRWLREVKNISVDISSNRYSEWEYIIRKINQLNHKDNTILALTACGFYTYEEAQESGIKKALEIILEKGE